MQKYKYTRATPISALLLFLAFTLAFAVSAVAQSNPSWVGPIIKWDANGGYSGTYPVYDPNTFLPGVKPIDQTCFTCHNAGRQPDAPDYPVAGGEDSPMAPGAQTSPFDGSGYLLSGHANVLRKVMPLVNSVPLTAGTGAPGNVPSGTLTVSSSGAFATGVGGVGTTAGSWGFVALRAPQGVDGLTSYSPACTTATEATDCAAYRGTSNWQTGTSLRGLAASWTQTGDAKCVVYNSHFAVNDGCMFPISGSLTAPIPGITAPLADHNATLYPAQDPYGSLSLFDFNLGTVNVGGTGTLANLFYFFGGWGDTNQLDSIWNGGFTGEQWPNGNYDCARCHTTGYRFDALGNEPTRVSAPTAVWSGLTGPTFNFTYSAKIPDTQFSRIPSNGACSLNDPATGQPYTNYNDCINAGGTAPTSSWYATGIQCTRCHGNNYCTGAVTKAGTQPPPGLDATNTPQCGWPDPVAKDAQGNFIVHPAAPYQPINQQATALCLECHREEVYNPGSGTTLGSIYPAWGNAVPQSAPTVASVPQFMDGGACADGSGSDYTTCTTSGSSWNFAPFIDHESGLSFLNSPHARFTGTIAQNVQNSVDLSVKLTGSYASYFTDWGEGMTVDESAWNSNKPVSNPPDGTGPKPLANGGCTGCHNPHDSVLHFSSDQLAAPGGSPANPPYAQPDGFAMPGGKRCTSCHSEHAQSMSHPTGPNTPFANGFGDQDSCVVCHMQGASGSPSYHFFRINADVNYNTFPTAAAFYSGSITPNTYSAEGNARYPAVGLDVDIACGQCHVGGTSGVNPYGITQAVVAPAYSRSFLAAKAANMHNTAASVPTFSVALPGTGGPTTITITSSSVSEGTSASIFYTIDGTVPTATVNAAEQYVPGGTTKVATGGAIAIPVNSTTTIYAFAAGPATYNFKPSVVAGGTYGVLVAPTPVIAPTGANLNYPANYPVKLSDSITAAVVCYTVDNSVPAGSNGVCSNGTSATNGSTIYVTKSEVLKAVATAANYGTSNVASATFTVTPPAPTFNTLNGAKFPGSFSGAQSASLGDADTNAGVNICYTLNGTTPALVSGVCNGSTSTLNTPITIPLGTVTIKGIAVDGTAVSKMVSGTYSTH